VGTPGRICLRLRSRISLIFLYISGWSFCNCFPSLDPLRRTLTNLFSNMHMFSKKVNFTWTSIFIRIYFHLQAFFFHHSVILLEHFHWLFTLFFLDEVFPATFLWMHSSRMCRSFFVLHAGWTCDAFSPFLSTWLAMKEVSISMFCILHWHGSLWFDLRWYNEDSSY